MAKKRVLIIDDEVPLARLLALNLQQCGDYEVHTEYQGQQGLAAARVFQPDVILLDAMLPDISGGEVAAQLQADPRLRDTPVIFLTAVVSEEEVQARGGMIGGHPYLAKPTTMQRVVACIEQQLHRAE